MNTTTKKFAWKDRDTAAYDLLQVVYHAPPSISQSAARLLTAIRSIKTLPELKAIFLDEKQKDWVRIYALRAFAKTPVDTLVQELEPITHNIIRQREEKIRQSRHPKSKETYWGLDFFDDILSLADKHPSNRSWFFNTLDAINEPIVLFRLLKDTFTRSYYSDEIRDILIKRFLAFLDAHPDFVDLEVVSKLSLYIDITQAWLEAHSNEIVELSLKDYGNRTILFIMKQWNPLENILREKMNNFDEIFSPSLHPIRHTHRQNVNRVNFQDSTAYKYLLEKYEQAADGDSQAMYELYRIVRKWQGNIPIRAVATHFIGKLYGQFDTFLTLSRLLRIGQDDWGEYREESPVRYEAGAALLKQPSSDTWEAYVDSFFISPRNVLSDFQVDWIAHMTDVLSGEVKDYSGLHYGEIERRSWFRALSEISEEEFKQMIPKK